MAATSWLPFATALSRRDPGASVSAISCCCRDLGRRCAREWKTPLADSIALWRETLAYKRCRVKMVLPKPHDGESHKAAETLLLRRPQVKALANQNGQA